MKASGSLQFRALRTFVAIAISWLALGFPALSQDKPAAPAPGSSSAAHGRSAIEGKRASDASFSYDVVSIRPYKPEEGHISVWGGESRDG